MESSKHHFSGGELGGMTSVIFFPFLSGQKKPPQKNHQGIQGRGIFYVLVGGLEQPWKRSG